MKASTPVFAGEKEAGYSGKEALRAYFVSVEERVVIDKENKSRKIILPKYIFQNYRDILISFGAEDTKSFDLGYKPEGVEFDNYKFRPLTKEEIAQIQKGKK